MNEVKAVNTAGFKLPLNIPMIGVAGKTGSWRVQKPAIDISKCTRCYQCEIFCPANSIIVKEMGAIVDYDYCKGCGICAEVCPMKAIQMINERGE
ncbi:MAG: 4Fe-4S binding protein [Desulfurococcaceae archaeon]